MRIRNVLLSTFAVLFSLFLNPNVAAAQDQCQQFNETFGDWEICKDYGFDWTEGRIEHKFRTLNPSDGYLYGFSGTYGQMLCATNSNPLMGDWFSAGDCTEVCFDINVFKDGDGDDAKSAPFTPRIAVKGVGHSAYFTWSNSLTDNNGEGSGWRNLCAPVTKLSSGELPPIATDGSWTFSGSSNDWNDLFSAVDYVQLKMDSIIPTHEELGYDNICLKGVTCPNEQNETPLMKTCDPIDASTGAPWSLDCQIEVQDNRPSEQIKITDLLGGVAPTAISMSSSDPWNCTGNECTISGIDFPSNGVSVINVSLTLDELPEGEENCASGIGISGLPKDPIVGENPQPTDPVIDWNLESCTPIKITGELPPKPLLCEAFTPTVTCGQAGGYQVSLTNSLSGTFDPTSIDVTVLTQGVTAQSNQSDPLTLFLTGAKPGETVKMSLASRQHGAGSETGLDLCCMGDLEVTIPEDLICEPPKVHLEVSKTCVANEQNDLGNTICHIDVSYSGPTPTASNPLTLSDTQVSGTPMQVQAQWEPQGANHYWECGLATGTPPFAMPPTCEMYEGLTPSAGHDWTSFNSTLTFFLDTDGPYKNCALGEMTLADGSVLQAEDCHSEGDADLIIAKSANFDVCYPGQICQFEYTVTNIGTGDYSDTITLLETNLTPAGGTIDKISPPLCANASDLLGAGCSGHADVSAGATVTYTVDYIAPTGLTFPEGGEMISGNNCVSLDDTTLGEFDELTEENGHLSCTDFEIGRPDLEIEKVANGACVPGAPCAFKINISTKGAPFSGRLAIVEQMIGQGASITSISSSPPFVPGCVPTTAFEGCVVDVALAANETFTLDVTAEITGYLPEDDAHGSNHNCVSVGLVPNTAPLGSFDPTAMPPWFTSWVAVHDDAVCVPFDPPREESPVDLTMLKEITTKTAPSDIELPAGELPVFSLTPVIASGSLTPGAVITVAEDLSAHNMTYVYSDAPGWTCSEASNVLSCSYTVPGSGAAPGSIEVGAQHLATSWDTNCADVSVSGQIETNLNNNTSCISRGDTVEVLDLSIVKSSDMVISPTNDISFTLTPTVVSGALSAGQVVEIVDLTQAQGLGLGQVLPSLGWSCDTSITCQFTVTSDGQALPPLTLLTSVPPTGEWQNCATIEALSNGQSVAETDLENNESCVVSVSETSSDLETIKTCEPPFWNKPGALDPLNGNWVFKCSIVVTGTPSSGTITVTDDVIGAGIAEIGVFGGDWTCDRNAGQCTKDVADFTSPETIPVTLHQKDTGAEQIVTNCAGIDHGTQAFDASQREGPNCAQIVLPPYGVGVTSEYSSTKTCEPLQVDPNGPDTLTCEITVTGTSLNAGTDAVRVFDELTSQASANGTEAKPVTTFMANANVSSSENWSCNDISNLSPYSAGFCDLPVNDLISAGGTSVLTVTAQIQNGGGLTGDLSNCTSAAPISGLASPSTEVCVNIGAECATGYVETAGNCVPETGSNDVDLELTKALVGSDNAVPLQFRLTPNLVSGTLQIGDEIYLDELFGAGTSFASVPTPSTPWICFNVQNILQCSYVVGSDLLLPAFPTNIEATRVAGLEAWVNCAKIRLRRNGSFVAESDMSNNDACFDSSMVGKVDVDRSARKDPDWGVSARVFHENEQCKFFVGSFAKLEQQCTREDCFGADYEYKYTFQQIVPVGSRMTGLLADAVNTNGGSCNRPNSGGGTGNAFDNYGSMTPPLLPQQSATCVQTGNQYALNGGTSSQMYGFYEHRSVSGTKQICYDLEVQPLNGGPADSNPSNNQACITVPVQCDIIGTSRPNISIGRPIVTAAILNNYIAGFGIVIMPIYNPGPDLDAGTPVSLKIDIPDSVQIDDMRDALGEWACEGLPATGRSLFCSGVLSKPASLGAKLAELEFEATFTLDGPAEICGEVSLEPKMGEQDLSDNRNCVTLTPEASPVSVELTKTCEALGSSTGPGGRFCTISLATENLKPGQTLTISENMLSSGSSRPDLVGIFAAQSSGWTCNQPAYSASNMPECSIATDDLISQGGAATMIANVQVSQDFLDGSEPQNCVSASIQGQPAGGDSCVDFTSSIPTPPTGPVLEPFKKTKGDCTVNKAAQTYSCAFEIGVKNVGTGGYSGPLVLDDTFGAPKPKSVKTLDGEGWSCLRTDGLGTSCLNGSVQLAAGETSQVAMEVVIPGLASGGTFENCVGVGIGDSKFLRASVMQSILQKLGIDGGPVDGAPGRKTRVGVRALQERLGVEPTGDINDETFKALGVPSTDGVKPSCISIDLPPMPVTEVTCEPGQKKNSRGVCYWPETNCPSGQVKNSKGQCYTPPKSCPSGQKLNSKGQCYTPRKTCSNGQILDRSGNCYTAPPQCEARSTLQKGGECACRYSGMRKATRTRCVCRNTGLSPIPGAGCPTIKIDRGEGDGAGGGKNCVILNGQRLCI